MRRICFGFILEGAFLDEEDVLGIDEVVEARREDAHPVVGAAAMNAQAALGAARRGASALHQRVPERHVALDAVGARALHFAVDIEQRRAVDVNNVAARHRDVARQLVVQEQARDVDLPAIRLAVALAGEDHHVGAGGRDPAGDGDHLGDLGVEGLERVAARPADLAEHRHLAAADGERQDAHLRLVEELAVLQRLGDGPLGRRDSHAAHFHRADERIADGSVLAYPRLERQVRILEHGDADVVAGAQAVFEPVLRLSGRRSREEPEREGKKSARLHCRPRTPFSMLEAGDAASLGAAAAAGFAAAGVAAANSPTYSILACSLRRFISSAITSLERRLKRNCWMRGAAAASSTGTVLAAATRITFTRSAASITWISPSFIFCSMGSISSGICSAARPPRLTANCSSRDFSQSPISCIDLAFATRSRSAAAMPSLAGTANSSST